MVEERTTKPEVIGQEKVREGHVTYEVRASTAIDAVTYVAHTAGTVPLAVAQIYTAAIFTAAAIVLQYTGTNTHGTSNPTLTLGPWRFYQAHERAAE